MGHRFHKLPQLRQEVGVAFDRPSCRTGAGRSRVAPARSRFRASSAVLVVVEVGSGHELFIRGQGGPLSWERGQKLTRAQSGLWVWSTHSADPEFQFQLLLDDEIWEKASPHSLGRGATLQVTPDFEWPEIPRTTVTPALSESSWI